MGTKIVQAWVRNFRASSADSSDFSGFGFAETNDLEDGRDGGIFFHSTTTHQVVIEGDTCVITDIHQPHSVYLPQRMGRNPVWLVMEVEWVRGGKDRKWGWRAVRWGKRPGPDWAHGYVGNDLIEQYIGGHFQEAKYTDHNRDEFITGQVNGSGRLKSISVTPATLTTEVEGVEGSQAYNLMDSRRSFTKDGKFQILVERGLDGERRHTPLVLTIRHPSNY